MRELVRHSRERLLAVSEGHSVLSPRPAMKLVGGCRWKLACSDGLPGLPEGRESGVDGEK